MKAFMDGLFDIEKAGRWILAFTDQPFILGTFWTAPFYYAMGVADTSTPYFDWLLRYSSVSCC